MTDKPQVTYKLEGIGHPDEPEVTKWEILPNSGYPGKQPSSDATYYMNAEGKWKKFAGGRLPYWTLVARAVERRPEPKFKPDDKVIADSRRATVLKVEWNSMGLKSGDAPTWTVWVRPDSNMAAFMWYREEHLSPAPQKVSALDRAIAALDKIETLALQMQAAIKEQCNG